MLGPLSHRPVFVCIHVDTPIQITMLNFEDVEERDGECVPCRDVPCVILCRCAPLVECLAVVAHGGDPHRRAHIRALHSPQAPRGSPARPLRARHVQAPVSCHPQPLLVPSFLPFSPPLTVPSSQIDIRGKLWICPFCLSRNAFPPHYKDISNTNLPAELLPKYTTIEYTLSRPVQVPPVFLFVVDTCLDDEDLKALRDAIVVSLSLLPPYALVGLVTYGTMVRLPLLTLVMPHTAPDSSP